MSNLMFDKVNDYSKQFEYDENTKGLFNSLETGAYELLKVAKEHETLFHDNPNCVLIRLHSFMHSFMDVYTCTLIILHSCSKESQLQQHA